MKRLLAVTVGVLAVALAVVSCLALGGCVGAWGVTKDGDWWAYSRPLIDYNAKSEHLVIKRGDTTVDLQRAGVSSTVDNDALQAISAGIAAGVVKGAKP